MVLKFVRNALGLVIVFFDWISRPQPIRRNTNEQIEAQAKLNGHALYQFFACPFCVKTRRAIHALGVDVELRDINKEPRHRQDLEQGGGAVKVPCLRIDENGSSRWIYESNDIIQYLNSRVVG